MPLTPTSLEASLLRDQVCKRLRDAIITMELKPGERLVERELSLSTGVSRATIREALRELASEGLVTVLPQRGVVVRVPTLKEAEELYELRSVIEGLAGRRFAQRASDEQVRELREAHLALAAAHRSHQDITEILARKAEFYDVLFAGADSPTMETIAVGLRTRVNVMRHLSLGTPGREEESVREIEAITDAVEQRDADASERACIAHVQRACEVAMEAMSGWEVGPDGSIPGMVIEELGSRSS